MQLKLRRSQRDGLVSSSVIFCLDARAELTEQERANLSRYKLYDQVIYNSDSAKRSLDKSYAGSDSGTAKGFAAGMFHLAMVALKLNVTIKSLERGHHIECKSLDELLGAEEAITQACHNLRKYLEVATTFNGSEMVVDFSGDEPRMIASAIRPEPILAPTQSATTIHTSGPELSAPEMPQHAARQAPAASSYAGQPFDLGEALRKAKAMVEPGNPKAPLMYGAVLVLVLLLLKCHG